MDVIVGQPYEFTDEEIARIVDTHAIYDTAVIFSDKDIAEIRKIEKLVDNEKED